jgi:hypothetical protein
MLCKGISISWQCPLWLDAVQSCRNVAHQRNPSHNPWIDDEYTDTQGSFQSWFMRPIFLQPHWVAPIVQRHSRDSLPGGLAL